MTNSIKTKVNKNRALTKAKKNLLARQLQYDSMKDTTGFTRPGSLKIR